MFEVDYVELAIKYAHAYSAQSSFDVGDLISYAYFGLVDAQEKYDPSKGMPFEKYVRIKIYNAMIDGIRKESGRRKINPQMVALDEYIPDASDVQKEIELREAIRKVNKAMAALPERQRLIIKRHYIDGAKFGEIARECSISAGRTSQLHKEAICALREMVSA